MNEAAELISVLKDQREILSKLVARIEATEDVLSWVVLQLLKEVPSSTREWVCATLSGDIGMIYSPEAVLEPATKLAASEIAHRLVSAIQTFKVPTLPQR